MNVFNDNVGWPPGSLLCVIMIDLPEFVKWILILKGGVAPCIQQAKKKGKPELALMFMGFGNRIVSLS